jgi:hypothetical protein
MTTSNVPYHRIVSNFRRTATPTARKLASLLSAAPVITLPIVRIIQAQILKECQQVHVAEVFLGGILKRSKGEYIKKAPAFLNYSLFNNSSYSSCAPIQNQ